MRITAEMLWRQARLMSRSAVLIARHPRYASGLTRLVRSGGKSTVTLRLPWLPYELVDELDARTTPGTKVFEFGGGGSTLFFVDRGADVFTVEHDPAWMARLEQLMRGAQWTGMLRSSDDLSSYVGSIAEHDDDTLDLVVVDGRERVRCALAALDKVRPGGLLIFDDVDRERYASALSAIPWPRRDYIGFAPAKPSLAFTAVFERPAVG